jgi:hypothetical protein
MLTIHNVVTLGWLHNQIEKFIIIYVQKKYNFMRAYFYNMITFCHVV